MLLANLSTLENLQTVYGHSAARSPMAVFNNTEPGNKSTTSEPVTQKMRVFVEQIEQALTAGDMDKVGKLLAQASIFLEKQSTQLVQKAEEHKQSN